MWRQTRTAADGAARQCGSVGEVAQRAKTSAKMTDARSFRVGRWRIDPTAREATDGTVCHRLSPRASGVLCALAEAHGKVVARDALLDAVWPGVHVCDDSLTQAIAELRRALGDRSGGRRMIETVPKGGYRLTEPVMTEVATTAAVATHRHGHGDEAEASSLDAHVLMLEAEQLARLEGSRAAAKIQSLIDEAVKAAPRDAAVQARFAVLTALAALHAGDRRRCLRAAAAAAEAAVDLRPDQAGSHAAYGFVAAGWNSDSRCRSSFALAVALDRNDADTHYLGAQAFFGLGDARTTAALAERATVLMPGDYRPAFFAARAASALGDAPRAARAARQALRRVDEALADDPSATRLISAREGLAALVDRTPNRSGTFPIALRDATEAPYFYDVIARVEAGEISAALDVLESMIDGGWGHGGWLAADPIASRLRTEPRFRRLAATLQAA